MPSPQSMHFIDLAGTGGPEILRLTTGPVPRPGPGEVLIRTVAAGVNRADLIQRQGQYPPPPGASPILGMEVSGYIAELGPGVTSRWRPGDPVCALLAGGGYAEYCAVPEGQCMAVPTGVSIRDAAAIPEAVITVWANLFEPRQLFPGDRFLVQGGASGIGTSAIQMARAFGARVATTAGSEEKCKFCLNLGAEVAVNYRASSNAGDWAAEVARWAHPHGVDVILDMIGGDYFPKHIELLAARGRLVHISTSHGREVTLDLHALMVKRLVVTGSTLRARPIAEKSSLARSVERDVWPLFANGQLRPIIDRVFPLDQAADAHRWMESGGHTGKIILFLEHS
ncbi:MAG: NAD(P)H-quinone oxidoreductase [Acidobacteriaceae bacterium]